MLAVLEKLTDTHFYARSVNDTAAMILATELKRLVMTGELDNLISKAPVVVSAKPESDVGAA